MTETTMQMGSRRGFTLIEILVVVVFVAIVSGFAVPRLDLGKYRSDAAARLVVSQLQQAERMAVQRQFDILVSFDLAANRLRIVEDRNNNHGADAGEPVRWRALEEREKFARPPAGITGSTAAPVLGAGLRTVDGMPTITFRRDGSTSTSAEIYLTAGNGAAKSFRAITLGQAPGRLTWHRYDGRAWKEAAR